VISAKLDARTTNSSGADMTNRLTQFLLTGAMLVLPFFTMSGQSNSSTTITGEITDSMCAQNGSHAVMMQKNPSMGHDSESCAKKCAQMGAQYVLFDAAKKKIYTLDDQTKAAALAGHQVKITGSVSGSSIKVSSIDPA
jgi:hypothetical protein